MLTAEDTIDVGVIGGDGADRSSASPSSESRDARSSSEILVLKLDVPVVCSLRRMVEFQ